MPVSGLYKGIAPSACQHPPRSFMECRQPPKNVLKESKDRLLVDIIGLGKSKILALIFEIVHQCHAVCANESAHSFQHAINQTALETMRVVRLVL